MPVHRLRNIDIRELDEEQLVQEILNSKLATLPPPQVINLSSDKTDFKTVEQELEFQKTIDERVAKSRPVADPAVGDVIQPVATSDTQTVEVPVQVAVSDADIIAPENVLKAKIAKLKKQKKSLS